jgi:acetylglutamate synthase
VELSSLIARLLENIGSRSEVNQYLRYYGSADPQKFAIVKVSGRVLETSHDSLVSSFTFLHRVGLFPIIVLDAEPQLERALAGAAPSESLAIARGVFEAESLRLAEALEAAGTRARPLHGAVFQAELVADRRLGRATGAVTASIVSAIRTKQLPILSPVGETMDGRIVQLDPDDVIAPLAKALSPHKIISLTTQGGLRDRSDAVIPAVNLEEDLPAVLDQLAPEQQHTIQRLAELLRDLPRTTSVSITSPDHLARELFTHRGAGTLIRLGEQIMRHDTFGSLDRGRLGELIENSFGRPLAGEYFTTRVPLRIYLAASYRATAILTSEHIEVNGRKSDIAYLDKFAVTSEAQGEGIGASLWQRMRTETPALFWRARSHNPVNSWYMRKADGMHKFGEWIVFWAGTDEFSTIHACVEKALALPASLAADEAR